MWEPPCGAALETPYHHGNVFSLNIDLGRREKNNSSNLLAWSVGLSEVGAFYWTVLAPDIVNPGREEWVSIQL